MKTRNILNLFTAFSASLFIFKGVNAAFPTCDSKKDDKDTTIYTNDTKDYTFCIYKATNQLSTYDVSNNKNPPTPISFASGGGLVFVKKVPTYTTLSSGETSASFLLDVSVTEKEGGSTEQKTATEKTIEKDNYIDLNGLIISCTDKGSCSDVTPSSPASNVFFIQNQGKKLIKYDSSTSKAESISIKEGYYLNGAETTQLIQCKSGECKEVSGSENNIFIDAGSDDEKSPNLIKCVSDTVAGADPVVKCTSESVSEGVFVNSSEIDKATKPLISCKSNKCEAVDIKESSLYFEDSMEPSKVIHCTSSPKCSKEDGADGDIFVGRKTDSSDEAFSIIKCEDKGKENEPKIECKIDTPSSDGYYLNAGSDASSNQVIACDNGCSTLKVNPGYYKNANAGKDATNIFIECVNECKIIEKSAVKACISEPESSMACYDASSSGLKFLEKSTNVTEYVYSSSDLYSYTNVASFPTINNSNGVTTLFRISKYGIERYISSGVIAVSPSSHQLVTDVSNSVIGTDVELYDCSTSTKICTQRASCQANTYMFDAENNKALNCDSDAKLVDVSTQGNYFVDTSTLVGSRTPYIISCSGGVCSHILPSTPSYYINSGYDNETKALIYCNGSSCSTTAASSGNYIANQQEGIIVCTSSSNCSYKDAASAGSNTNYVNAGANKSTYALISCKKNVCMPKAARTGYYFSDSVTSLIYCESNNVCNVITPTVNYYFYADTSDTGKNYIINCSKIASSIVCAKEVADTGSYLTSQSNVLVTCSASGTCKQEVAKPGYYQSAVKITINTSRDLTSVGSESELVSDITARDSTTTYNIIECSTTNCELLTAEELANIPVCEYSADKCYITLAYALGKTTVNSISAGGICTNADRSVFYFATDTIVVAPNVIAGTTTTYVYTTTTTNCIVVGKKYADQYYTVGSDIYRLNDGTVSHFFDTGNYFINVEKNALVNGNNIDNYNDENVKLYQCNGTTCKILDSPENSTYFADVNKRILKFNVNSDSYSFAYEKDIICIFANNKCTPNADLNGREFCITYKGEICLAANDIKNRETGECYRASSVGNSIYGYNQYLYKMNLYSATIVEENGYNIVSLSTNNTVSSKDYKNRLVNGNSIKIYGCHSASCKVYEPEEDVYYYDDDAKVIIKKEEESWVAPSTSGYALISSTPGEKYIYKFKTDNDQVTLLSKAASGYYYTIDNEMYDCNENDNECVPISETDYYFTNTGEIYYCVYDSENLEKTECTKQSCYVGQNYYISENYYRCEAGSYLTPIKSRNCKYDENVVVNFPTILKEEFPNTIKQAIESIEKNNNSTAVATRSNKKYLSVVPAIFTNCTYNVEETEASYDFVCINNYVSVNEDDDSLEICSIENLGYVECVDDETNPEKCTPSSAFTRVVFNFFTIAITVFSALYLMLF